MSSGTSPSVRQSGATPLLRRGALLDSWNIGKAEDLYGVGSWGKGFFSISPEGDLLIHPGRSRQQGINLPELVAGLRRQGVHPPLLLRFPQVLHHRLQEIHNVFNKAIADSAFQGKYTCVYPIKVNQQRHVVQEIRDFGREFGFGLEAGSKPELLAMLSLVDDNRTLMVCNGFKDSDYVEMVVQGQKLGRRVIPVIESLRELRLILETGSRHDIRPILGVRVKLASRGSGKWESSSGEGSKFGLSAPDLLACLAYLKERGLADCLQLLHFHIGSQITNIRNIKDAINEGARIFVELVRAGAGLQTLDVGGGLGIDYDGSQTNFGSSVNYTLSEYASDVVFGVQSVCDQAGVPHPEIVSESGRAIAAYYSMLVFNVLDVSEVPSGIVPARPEGELALPIANLYDTLGDLSPKNALEMVHDALKYREDSLNLFNLGYLSLADRALAEEVFWSICHTIEKMRLRGELQHEDLEILEPMLADIFLCNYSVFQSMPDSWAVNQLFPIMPIHRLGERPERKATLADLTCDSDGKIDRFIDLHDVKQVLSLHAPNGTDYYLGAFLVGAYQEILGDLHNLFGDTNAVHVMLGRDGVPVVERVVSGDRVRDVLRYVQFTSEELTERLRRNIMRAVEEERISSLEAHEMINFHDRVLDGTTYLR